MSPISDARKRANKKWNDANMKERYDRVQLVLAKGMKEQLQAAAAASGESVNAYVNRAIAAQMERERAGAVPAGGVPAGAVSPEGTSTQGAGVMVFSGGVPDDNSSSRLSPLTTPDSQTGLDTWSTPKQESLLDIVKRLNAMSPEERERALGCDPESVERYRQEMERKRQRLAELNAKAGGLSRSEDAERRRLMVDCKHYPESGDSAQE